ncbi:hypothetical Protein YC6258_05763 [Gynuella sunshinyii YC6258]|uniref:Uncharacterized protein n=1 Tax=Gynuella sunshinyii YC6258 TaxID=1445510 RepID=A0A0C5VUH0_9GAMM|nr:hypothetical Protein YC6258_05763 [Gynuella sunshinyii YC6258]
MYDHDPIKEVVRVNRTPILTIDIHTNNRHEKQFRCFAGQRSSFEKVRDYFQLSRTPPNLLAT